MNETATSVTRTLLNPATLLGAIAFAVIIAVIAAILIFAVRRVAKRLEPHLTDVTGLRFASRLVQGVVIVVAIVLYAQIVPELRSFGTALLTGVSVVSIIVGLAAQSTLSNVIAGISLVLYRPISVGNVLQLQALGGTVTATVDNVGLGYTTLRDGSGHEIIIPNSVMVTTVVVRLGTNPAVAAAAERRSQAPTEGAKPT